MKKWSEMGFITNQEYNLLGANSVTNNIWNWKIWQTILALLMNKWSKEWALTSFWAQLQSRLSSFTSKKDAGPTQKINMIQLNINLTKRKKNEQKRHREKNLFYNQKQLRLPLKKFWAKEQLRKMLLGKEKMMTIMRIKMRLRLKKLRCPLERD